MAVRPSLTGTLIFLLLARLTSAGWSVSSSEAEKSSAAGLEHRHVVLAETESGDEATLDLALFSTKSAVVRVTDNPAGNEDLASVMRRVRGLAGVNGGYFDPQNAPVGLLISDGKLIAPFRKARLLSGVLVATKGRVELLRAAEYSSRKTATAAFAMRAVSRGRRKGSRGTEQYAVRPAHFRVHCRGSRCDSAICSQR